MTRQRLMPTGECWCGCSKETKIGSFFLPGHDKVAESAVHFARQNQELWTGVQESLDESTQAIVAQQSELTKQGEVLLSVVESTGQVAKLEETLNRNLESLSGSQNFEETVQSLAAVIHLLNTRIGRAA